MKWDTVLGDVEPLNETKMTMENNSTETRTPGSLHLAGSAKWVVRDLTRVEPSVSCDTKEQAEAWVRHLWEWRPNARPVIEQEISPNTDFRDSPTK